ncbi:hypothetical protein [Micromonospora sp. WMMD1082]|uniref:hypothetical protein n=1 Tax=Micromonospora sp. WMMD1082 TaxID=3016104 RepID=UPI002417FB04|nr:hypothetical protein [Micromonospora sp. WMMD1082]MDG4796228.1 hypothetical protein [Micromonospora sp. WMMD1082]
MNFGMRLPGPFRVGINSNGRMNVGATLGPLSVSSGGGQPRRPQDVFAPVSLDTAVAEMGQAGWRVTGGDERTVFMRGAWRAIRIDAVPGGVSAAVVTSRRQVVAAVVLVVAVLAWCLW